MQGKTSEFLDRRQFMSMTAVAGASAVLGAPNAMSADAPPAAGAPPRGLAYSGRIESQVPDCEVEGKIPSACDGAFYRVGPDYQYPPNPNNIPFDGDGHISMFKIANGRIDYKDRFVRTQRFKAQDAARRALFGVYRNPFSDDPAVKNVSRGTANTHVMFHHGKLLALKEDSPPVVVDTETLETMDDYYTLKGKLESKTFTAHPKIDGATGNMVAFGYEAKGFATDDVNVFEIDPKGNIVWQSWIKVPYIGMLHDFSVTQKHIVFYVMPMAVNMDGMKQGKVHWAWDSTLPTYFGVMRRGGDGKDIRWFKGPERCATHVMSAFSDGEKVYVDVPMAKRNQFAFIPQLHESFDPLLAQTRMTRLSVDLSKKSVRDYQMEELYPHSGELPRIDERYLTLPYKTGFLMVSDPTKPRHEKLDPRVRLSNCYVRMNHYTRKTST
ncbi:MAG TPA: carotenoid oxygenase family protein, partial [Steroidobacteraceae bacterium]|nr:carotenoid oxygenase family protein [Steroidobacteraceae bacterium]